MKLKKSPCIIKFKLERASRCANELSTRKRVEHYEGYVEIFDFHGSVYNEKDFTIKNLNKIIDMLFYFQCVSRCANR